MSEQFKNMFVLFQIIDRKEYTSKKKCRQYVNQALLIKYYTLLRKRPVSLIKRVTPAAVKFASFDLGRTKETPRSNAINTRVGRNEHLGGTNRYE